MIRKEAKLVEPLLDPKIPQKPTRDGYGLGVVEAAEKNPNVLVVCADLTDSTRNADFKKMFPDRKERTITQNDFDRLLAEVGTELNKKDSQYK